MRASHRQAVLLALSLAVATVTAVAPTPRATPLEQTGRKDRDTLLRLKAGVTTPDDNQLDWPINVLDRDLTVVDASVTLHDFWHEHAEDLRITLRHATKSVDLLRFTGGAKTFGMPRIDRYPHRTAQKRFVAPSGTDQVDGDGFDYTFSDSGAVNLALNQPTEQSTTDLGGVSSRAVDGDVRGFFGLETVTHTGGHGTNDPQPWWEVDVGNGMAGGVANIGTIRVWNREQEITQDEVQVVRLRSKSLLPATGSTFTLNITWNGETAMTPPISLNAVATVADEVEGDDVPDGAGVGESMESKIETMPNINQVTVVRKGPFATGGYDWTVTFVSEPGNLPSMTSDISGIDPNPVPSVEIITNRNGSDNIYYNYKTERAEISGRLFPSWVMVSNSSVGTAGLEAAIANSHFRRRLTDTERREQTIVLPPGISGRYVRVQLEDADYLSIAEVQVFEERLRRVSDYEGGSPIAAGNFQPEFSMVEVFGGEAVDGMWLLSIDDVNPRSLVADTNSRPVRFAHGTGAMNYWSLQLTCSDGSVRSYQSGVMFTIKTMPFFGTLYYYNATSGTRGDIIPTVLSQERYLSGCYGNCDNDFGVGTQLDTRKDGSVADPSNRIDFAGNHHSIVYVPNTNWLGSDRFRFAATINEVESPWVDGEVHVRRCRIDCDNDIFNDIVQVRSDVSNA